MAAQLPDVDNMESIRASMIEYEILKGIREVPMADFKGPIDDTPRVRELAARIKASKSISPLIIVIDKAGRFILEGSHRIDALKILKARSFPALVVLDWDSLGETLRRPDLAPHSVYKLNNFDEDQIGTILVKDPYDITVSDLKGNSRTMTPDQFKHWADHNPTLQWDFHRNEWEE